MGHAIPLRSHAPTLNLVLLIGLCTAVASGQSTDANVSGTVTDPTGANVPAVTVVALNAGTGVTTSSRSNEAGVFVFASLPPGTYRVTAEHSGFRKAVVEALVLDVAARATLNLKLELGTASESVEVSSNSAALGYSTASIANIVTGRQILDLPLAGRSTYDLIATTGGTVSTGQVSGQRIGSLNITSDGIQTQDNLLTGLYYAGVANQIRTDRVEEFRLVTSPNDVELGRGSGQLQVVTRQGSNAFHGSAWEEHRNTVLNANDWFSNAAGRNTDGSQVAPRNFLIRNQFGARVGGPFKKNKTFFNGYYEGERQVAKNNVTSNVLTDTAKQGLFRFFPGVQNGNVTALVPTVDASGNPLMPATATGSLQSVSLFGRDPNRLLPDSSGIVRTYLAALPSPNNFRVGDGLNTAGYTWSRRQTYQFETFEGRVDHTFNDKHRATVSFSHQAYDSLNVFSPATLPGSPGGHGPTETTSYVAAFTSALRPNLLNEFRAGIFRPRTDRVAAYEKQYGQDDKLIPKNAAGVPFLLSPTNYAAPLSASTLNDSSQYLAPVYQYGDSISWLKGKHAFKGGFEYRFVSTNGFDVNGAIPRATIGAGSVAVQNISAAAIPGLAGSNVTLAQSLLNDLSGSLSSASQIFNTAGGSNPVYISGQTRYRNWIANEYDWFFKDEFKAMSNLNFNIGLRYEHYNVPHEGHGQAAAPVGGGAGAFGVSGTGFADMFQPGHLAGSPMQYQLVGANSPHPDASLYNADNNNFGPGVGLVYSLPWFGKNKTIIRAGYGISYSRSQIYETQNISGLAPGLSDTTTYITPSLLTLSNLTLPLSPSVQPLALIPLTDRTKTINTYDNNLRNPYIQNWNFSITLALPGNGSLDIRYVGSKSTKLIRAQNVNEVNIFENGFLDAFKITQAGGTAPLFDQLLVGLAPGVNGTTVHGSDYLRNTNLTTQFYLYMNDPGSLASFFNTTTTFGAPGTVLRRAGLPENFFVANPQVTTSYLTSNLSASTYNSLQVEYVRRFRAAWSLQANYTFSKSLGDYEGDTATEAQSFRTARNFAQDKHILTFDRTHVLRSNGIWELPFGPGKWVGRSSKGILARVIGGWQTGAIYNLYSGTPVPITSQNVLNTVIGISSPQIVGTLPATNVTYLGSGVTYFPTVKQVPDPSISLMAAALQRSSSLKALADLDGNLILAQSRPGQMGGLGYGAFFRSPVVFRLDLNLIKNVSLTERVKLQLRADAINLTNSPAFSGPTSTDISSSTFGKITSQVPLNSSNLTQNRLITVQGRVTF